MTRSSQFRLSVLACTMCKDPMFLAWLNVINQHDHTSNDAKLFILAICDIDSRKELDVNTVAVAKFSLHIRHPFMKWRQSQEPLEKAA